MTESAAARKPADGARVRVVARGPLRGTITVPGDKSVSHRALILAGLAHGTSEITGLSGGLDVAHTRQIMQALGVQTRQTISDDGVETLTVQGGPLTQAVGDLDVGNSGTGARLLAGVCAGQAFHSVITGDASIATRPMDRVVEPLRAMGARIEGRNGGRFTPLVIDGGDLHGIDYAPPIASAQVKGAILLAGLFAEGTTTVRERTPTRRHTEELMAEHGVDISTVTSEAGNLIILHPGPVQPGLFAVPGDPSQAAFWICAAAAIPGSDVTVTNLYLSPERAGFLDVLLDMGADLDIDPVSGTVRARGAELQGTMVGPDRLPDLIDEVPALAVAGALAASGSLLFADAAELRAKESDRIATVAGMITALSGSAIVQGDSLDVKAAPLAAGRVASHHDHRIAMAAAVAATGMRAGEWVEIDDWSCVATSYPRFLDDLARLTDA